MPPERRGPRFFGKRKFAANVHKVLLGEKKKKIPATSCLEVKSVQKHFVSSHFMT